jgi:hypothetical protein
MKLIYCTVCEDIVKLRDYERKCACRSSWGYYHPDEKNATIGGFSVPLGISNLGFKLALADMPEGDIGKQFEAFIIPKECKTVHVLPPSISVKEKVEYRLQLLLNTLPTFPVGRLDCRSEVNAMWLVRHGELWVESPYADEIHERAVDLLRWYDQNRNDNISRR